MAYAIKMEQWHILLSASRGARLPALWLAEHAGQCFSQNMGKTKKMALGVIHTLSQYIEYRLCAYVVLMQYIMQHSRGKVQNSREFVNSYLTGLLS